MQGVASWGDAHHVTRLKQKSISIGYWPQSAGEALDVVAARWKTDPFFAPKPATAMLEIVEIAARGGRPRWRAPCIADPPDRFAAKCTNAEHRAAARRRAIAAQ